MAASAWLLAAAGDAALYPVRRHWGRVAETCTAFTSMMRERVRESGLVHTCIISVRLLYGFGAGVFCCLVLPLFVCRRLLACGCRLEILMKFPLRRVVVLPLVVAGLAASHAAMAGNFADAAIAQAGGTPPREMDLLGSPQGYGDVYGPQNNGRGGQRVTGMPTDGGVSPTDRLIAQQNGYVGNPAGGAQLRRAPRGGGAGAADAKGMNNAQGAAAVLYPTPNGLKPPTGNGARVREIYKSPY
jgi:hypothetical protein